VATASAASLSSPYITAAAAAAAAAVDAELVPDAQ